MYLIANIQLKTTTAKNPNSNNTSFWLGRGAIGTLTNGRNSIRYSHCSKQFDSFL